MDYGFELEGKIYTPAGTVVRPTENDARNQAIEAAELGAWQAKPDYFVAYYNFPAETGRNPPPRLYREPFRPWLKGAKVTTWRGVTLGKIVSASVYQHNFGGRFVSLRVRGTNGAEYYGRASYDWGSVIRLRKAR